MCTVTVIARPGGFRLVTNRDELRTRGMASAPEVARLDGVRVVLPRDPDGGGSWVGANESGLALTVLNRFVEPVEKRPKSRGQLLLLGLQGSTRAEALRRVRAKVSEDYAPFEMLFCDVAGVSSLVWTGDAVKLSDALTWPLMRCSSGLGDAVVRPYRQQAFGAWRDDPTPAAQDQFHRGHDPAFAAESVSMSRPEASTVSTTWLEVEGRGSDARISMRYQAGAPHLADERTVRHEVRL